MPTNLPSLTESRIARRSHPRTAVERIGNPSKDTKRPKMQTANRDRTITELMNARAPIYQLADLTIAHRAGVISTVQMLA